MRHARAAVETLERAGVPERERGALSVSGRPTLATIVWLVAWAVPESGWEISGCSPRQQQH
jgi:hypothetical protein